jgi:ketosteroid isomerase-like protein
MTDSELTELAMRYFEALDARNSKTLAQTLTEDCVLTIQTHDIVYSGRDSIRTLFAARWEGPLKAVHHNFTHTPSHSTGRVASQFMVTYSGIGAAEPKSNANVFTMYNDHIIQIDVYMAGENTIKT